MADEQSDVSFFEFRQRLDEREAERSWRTDMGESYMADLANRQANFDLPDIDFFSKSDNRVDMEQARSETEAVDGQGAFAFEQQEQSKERVV